MSGKKNSNSPDVWKKSNTSATNSIDQPLRGGGGHDTVSN